MTKIVFLSSETLKIEHHRQTEQWGRFGKGKISIFLSALWRWPWVLHRMTLTLKSTGTEISGEPWLGSLATGSTGMSRTAMQTSHSWFLLIMPLSESSLLRHCMKNLAIRCSPSPIFVHSI